MDSSFSHIDFFAQLNKGRKLTDEANRQKKAKKILAVVEDYAEKNRVRLDQLRCLDIGCSAGLITKHFCGKFREIVGVDPDEKAIALAKQEVDNARPVEFVLGDGSATGLPSQSFDAVICNQVYEHVPDAEKLFEEIFRVLKPRGICYLSAGNKFMIMEPHYDLPFLSWLPQFLADRYLKAFRGVGIYAEKHRSYWGLKRMLKDFEIVDYTIAVIKEPGRFYLDDMIRKDSIISKIPAAILKLMLPIIPNFIFILVKKGA